MLHGSWEEKALVSGPYHKQYPYKAVLAVVTGWLEIGLGLRSAVFYFQLFHWLALWPQAPHYPALIFTIRALIRLQSIWERTVSDYVCA